MPKVSVIVPIYNVEEYLPKCLESLEEQTLKDIEVILVNDGSTDSSSNIAKEWAKKQKKVKAIYLEKSNGGLSDARNYGLKYATGDFIAFLDSDDYVEKTIYEKMYNKAISEDADFVECDFVWEYPEKQRIDKKIEYKNKLEMLAFVRVVAWNKLIKRNLIYENNLEFPKGLRYEDVEFTYKLIPHIKKYAYVNEVLVHYMQRENSIANVQNKRTAEIFNILENVENYYKEKGIYDEYKDAIEYNYARYLLCSSLKRMAKIADKEEKNKQIKKTWEILNSKYPEWKKNTILKNTKSGKNRYMRTVNSLTFKLYSKLFVLEK